MKPYYDRDGITIYHGDCREVTRGLRFDAIVTDAPYGVGMAYASFADTEPEVRALASFVGASLIPAVKRAAVFSGVPQMWWWPQPSWVLCWSYAPATNEFSPWGYAQWQPVLCYGKDPYLAKCLGPRPTLFTHATPPDKRAVPGHPCPKPEPVMRWAVSRTTDTDDLILDPFMGSGTTLVAAALEGRKAIGIEIEERYCEIAAKRLAQGVLNFGPGGEA